MNARTEWGGHEVGQTNSHNCTTVEDSPCFPDIPSTLVTVNCGGQHMLPPHSPCPCDGKVPNCGGKHMLPWHSQCLCDSKLSNCGGQPRLPWHSWCPCDGKSVTMTGRSTLIMAWVRLPNNEHLLPPDLYKGWMALVMPDANCHGEDT